MWQFQIEEAKKTGQFYLCRAVVTDVRRDAIVALLRGNENITALVLIGCDITFNNTLEYIADALRTNTFLIKLALRCTSIGHDDFVDNGQKHVKALAEAIGANRALTNLDLFENYIDDTGARFIADALKTNTILSTLDLTNNYIKDEGLAAIAEALKTNKSLTELNLRGNKIQDATALADVLKTNKTLTKINLALTWTGIECTRVFADALKTNSNLIELDLGYTEGSDECYAVREEIAKSLEMNARLAKLQKTSLFRSVKTRDDCGVEC